MNGKPNDTLKRDIGSRPSLFNLQSVRLGNRKKVNNRTWKVQMNKTTAIRPKVIRGGKEGGPPGQEKESSSKFIREGGECPSSYKERKTKTGKESWQGDRYHKRYQLGGQKLYVSGKNQGDIRPDAEERRRAI